MAKMIQKPSALVGKYRLYKGLSVLGIGGFFLSIVAHVVSMMTYNFTPLTVLSTFICFLFGVVMSVKANIYRSGVDGEVATARLIKQLPDTYVGIQNLKVTYDGKESEMDMVVIGPTGVFVVETKNTRGEICGNFDSTQWLQTKIGRRGTPYSKQMYSPVKQVGTHVYRLANHIRQNGMQVHVDSAVYFSNPGAVLHLNGTAGKIPVFSSWESGDAALVSYITNRQAVLTEGQVAQIVKLLTK